MDHMVEAAQVVLIKESEAPQAQEHMPTDEQDDEDEDEDEIKFDDCDVLDNHYPSGSKTGNLSDKEDALTENQDEDEDKEMEDGGTRLGSSNLYLTKPG